MAIAAVDAHSADVVRVAELNRLLDVHRLVGVVAGEMQSGDDDADAANKKQNSEETERE